MLRVQVYAIEIKGINLGRQQISDACARIDGNTLMYHYCGNFHSALNYVILMRVNSLSISFNVIEHI